MFSTVFHSFCSQTTAGWAASTLPVVVHFALLFSVVTSGHAGTQCHHLKMQGWAQGQHVQGHGQLSSRSRPVTMKIQGQGKSSFTLNPRKRST